MKKTLKQGRILCVLLVISLLSGCWNYREVEDMVIVSGVAVDKEKEQLLVTFEVVEIKTGNEGNIQTQLISSEGTTMLEAVRKAIKTVGKKLYFSHAKILVVSQEIAKDVIIPIIDWINRDAETRFTTNFLISREKTAREVFEQEVVTRNILAYELNDMLTSQRDFAYAYEMPEYRFLQELAVPGISATLPTISVRRENGQSFAEISGSAVFKQDRLVGFLTGEETRTLLFIKDRIEGGVLVNTMHSGDGATNISLEILDNKTKLKPYYDGENIIIQIRTKTDVTLVEIGGQGDYIEKDALAALKAAFEAQFVEHINTLVAKAQREFGSDIFGFGRSVRMNLPEVWRQIESRWQEMYQNVGVSVECEINIKNSSILSEPIKVGD
jgi:spore germination protein KC